DDPDVLASLPVLDRVIGRETPSGQGFYRYGTDLAGTEDGYGDCFEPDPTDCSPSGQPWPTTNTGSGHLWPVLSGERAEELLQAHDRAGAARLLQAMRAYATDAGLVPEQDWEDPDLPASPFGTAPETASIGYVTGEAAGSATPLTWAQAQELRLILSIAAGRPTALPGTAILDVTDPDGDDNGPGTYAYPTSDNFHAGAFDIERFQVIDAGDRVFLRAQLRDLTPTFGSPLGAQLLDVFIRNPQAGAFSTAAPFPSRNFAVAADSAWSSRIEAQGFADPVFVDAANRPLGTVAV